MGGKGVYCIAAIGGCSGAIDTVNKDFGVLHLALVRKGYDYLVPGVVGETGSGYHGPIAVVDLQLA